MNFRRLFIKLQQHRLRHMQREKVYHMKRERPMDSYYFIKTLVQKPEKKSSYIISNWVLYCECTRFISVWVKAKYKTTLCPFIDGVSVKRLSFAPVFTQVMASFNLSRYAEVYSNTMIVLHGFVSAVMWNNDCFRLQIMLAFSAAIQLLRWQDLLLLLTEAGPWDSKVVFALNEYIFIEVYAISQERSLFYTVSILDWFI